MLQTTNPKGRGESRSGKKIPRREACRFESGLGHQRAMRYTRSITRSVSEVSDAEFAAPASAVMK